MTDILELPKCLDLRIPANYEAWKERRRNWKPIARAAKNEAHKINRDSIGRALPKHMDEVSWKLLRELEYKELIRSSAEKAERFRLLKVAAQEKAEIKRAAKAAKVAQCGG